MSRFLTVLAATLFFCQCVQADKAGELIKDSGVSGGLIVNVGCTDGKFTAGLLAGDAYLVHGLSTDAGQVDEARKTIKSKGL